MIEINNISKVFRTSEVETVALNHVNLEVKEGEFVAIMGPSGCGKSTLLNILGLLDNPTEGSYRLMGEEVGGLKEKERTHVRKGKLGFVFQSFNLIDELNVYENVELPLTYLGFKASERRRMVEDILKRMNISHRAKHFPQQLSGGQQQRVAIARAVVTNPKLILADEPTGNLDSKNGAEVMNLLTELNKEGTTIIMVTHSQHEMSYEKCYPEAENLIMARIAAQNMTTGEVQGDDGMNYDYTVCDPVAFTLAQDMPEEIESATCVLPSQFYHIYKEDKLLSKANYMMVDTCFFETMGIPVLKGNAKDLIISNSIFVSEHFARETFGSADPIGKTLSADKQLELTIRGVYKDIPENSMLSRDFVITIHRDGRYASGNGWNGNDIFYAFARLRHASDIDKVNSKIQQVMAKYSPLQWDDWKLEYSVVPLSKRHLDSADTQKRLMIFGFLGFSVFFVAIMNYILISIATISRRAKSVGVHKCSGASSGNIFGMFLAETGVLVLLSVLFSFLLIINMGELIEDLLGTSLASLFAWDIIWIPLLTVVVLFLLAGGIPGKLFSRIPVTQVFRHYTDGKRGWKRSLLFVQFTGTSFVLGLLLVTLLQYSHLMNGDMGIKIPGLVEAETWMSGETVEHVKDELLRQPMVDGVSASTHSVLGEYWTRGLIGNDGKRIATLNFNMCDYDYPNVMGIRITEGTTIKKKGDLLVNKELVRLMKWTDGAVGKSVSGVEGTIVGVFDDIRNRSFYSSQSPIVLIADKESANHTINVRLKEPYDENLKRLNECVAKTFPNVALNFNSVDSMIREGYKSVYRFRNAVWISSCFILLIVITGLIGYVNGETQRRSKEIAIRKVNGAEASGILKLLIYDILNISVISVLIGTAASYFTGQIWLEQFSERIDMDLLLFIGIALLVLLVIVACVVVKAWHVANENPVKSIKAE